MNDKGINNYASQYTVRETTARLLSFLTGHGATIYAHIDQQAEAAKAGITLKPIEFLLFGNPAAGGKVMGANPVSALDLPLKMLVWQDEAGKVWVSCNDRLYLRDRFHLPDELTKPFDLEMMISNALK